MDNGAHSFTQNYLNFTFIYSKQHYVSFHQFFLTPCTEVLYSTNRFNIFIKMDEAPIAYKSQMHPILAPCTLYISDGLGFQKLGFGFWKWP